MLKKWKKFVKLLGTTVLLVIYVTIELFYNDATSKRGKNNESLYSGTEPTSLLTSETNKFSPTIKTIVSYSSEYKIRKELEDRIECKGIVDRHDKKSDDATSNWIHDRTLGIRMFSAYYDQRQEPYHYVRIIGLMPRNLFLYCQIHYETDESISYITQKAVIREIWSSSWGIKSKKCDDEYPVIISCLVPPKNQTASIPSRVSVVDKDCAGDGVAIKITSLPQPKVQNNFVVCVKPLHFSNIREKTLREWIEINQRLGADKIIIYFLNVTEAENLFNNETKQEFLIKKKFTVPKRNCPHRTFDQFLWHKRKMEIIAYNDCFYRNLYQTKFVIPLDVDEIIVPKTGNSWFEGFSLHFSGRINETDNFSAGNYASFSVRNAYFFSDYPKDVLARSFRLPDKSNSRVPNKLVKTQKSGSIFDRTVRSYRLSPKSDSVKSFVHVPKTLSVFNHFTFHVLGDAARQYIFPQNVFQLNHYRNSCDPVLIDGCQDFLNHVTYDDSLEKFRKLKSIS